LFSGLPNGLVITATRPSGSPAYYPAEISWNGIDLNYDPIDSSVSHRSGHYEVGAMVIHRSPSRTGLADFPHPALQVMDQLNSCERPSDL
jgi:hypothetical protein